MAPHTSSFVTNPSRRLRVTPRAAWFAARARNVLQRPLRLAVSTLATFLLVLFGYLLLPAGLLGVVRLLRPERVVRPDTVALRAQALATQRALVVTDTALRGARARYEATVASLAAPVLSPAEIERRDSLSRAAGALGVLVQRAENAPLPESYRALGESPWMRDDPRVRALFDSLAEITRERDALGGGAAVDPIFVALTTEANTLGRSIQGLADQRLAVLTQQIAQLQTPPPASEEALRAAAPDTLPAALARGNAAMAVARAAASLETARRAHMAADSLEALHRAQTQLAPMPILVAGAAIIAGVMAFALVLVDEVRSPRVADAPEAERLTALRVLAIARLRDTPANRARRAADRLLSPLLDPTHDAYRMLAWHLTAQWPADGIITVTGDEPWVCATVAANLAAVLANDARITLLIDADFRVDAVRAVLDLPRSLGLAAVLENRRKWSESLIPVAVGRSRMLDVLPSGTRERPLGEAEADALKTEIRRAARRHDATIVVSSLTGARRTRAGDDVIICAAQTRTRLRTLGGAAATLIDGGARVRGVVLWDGPLPVPRGPRGAQDAA